MNGAMTRPFLIIPIYSAPCPAKRGDERRIAAQRPGDGDDLSLRRLLGGVELQVRCYRADAEFRVYVLRGIVSSCVAASNSDHGHARLWLKYVLSNGVYYFLTTIG